MITNHNGGFDVDENALVTGAGLYVATQSRGWIKKTLSYQTNS